MSTYFQPADGAIDLNASDYLDYGQVYAIHKKVNSNKCLMMMHESLVAELWGQSVDGVNKLSMVVKSGAKAALGMVTRQPPQVAYGIIKALLLTLQRLRIMPTQLTQLSI